MLSLVTTTGKGRVSATRRSASTPRGRPVWVRPWACSPGGLLTEYANWRWVMFADEDVPIGLALGLAIPRIFPAVRQGIDRGEAAAYEPGPGLPGAVTSTVGVSALVYGFIRVSEQSQGQKDHTWTDGMAIASFPWWAVAFLALFVFGVN
ncbi:hypothetical protein ACU686_01040 [Yinghuangia aomiensis]